MAWWRNERGFTLAQILIACALLGIALAAVTIVVERGVRQASITTYKSEVQQNARVALEMMAREIRESRDALSAATASSITFTDPTGGVITYTIDGNNALTRNGVILIGGLRNLVTQPPLPLFGYRDANDAVLATPVGTPASVYRVDITIETGDDSQLATGLAEAATEMTTSVRLRNL
jgi:type II secretory pathway pseudopilin PulG